jgi:purine-nucleoside/S-methyl-5'-thioadenosine phosphorylase / adenosine deaminase
MAILRAALLHDAGFRHGFAERSAEPDAMANALGVSRVVQVKQVHGSRTIEVSEAAETSPETEADAIVARASVHPAAVGVRVADCVPILVADTVSGDVVAIHAGWRGVVAGVVHAAMANLRGHVVLAAIGPCIGACCFEVDRGVAEAVAGASGGASVVARWAGDKAWVDLRAAVRAQFSTLGLGDVRVEDVPGCTMHELSRFHSFRRDADRSGRMLAAIRPRLPS